MFISFLLSRRKKIIYGRFLEQPLFNARTRGATPLASLLDEGVASSFMHILPYVHLTSSLIFLYFTIIDCQSEPVS